MFKKTLILLAITLLLGTVSAHADSLTIPASAFTPQNSGPRYQGNESGTARFFGANLIMFAPVNIPDGTTVTSMRCGGAVRTPGFKLRFTLRRNEPQQQNVDMSTLRTTIETGFQFLRTRAIREAVINNDKFNYYIVAETERGPGIGGSCPKCSVNFCTLTFPRE